MNNTETTVPDPTPEVKSSPADVNDAIPGHVANTVVPDTVTPEPKVTTQAPDLTLWELMRADLPSTDTGDDDSSRILSNPRPSIWDLP